MRDHKSLEAWIEARAITCLVLHLSREHWRPYAAAVFHQLQRASLSVQLNIAEGYALQSRARFVNHLTMAYGSAVETAELLELACAEGLFPTALGSEALARNRRCQALLIGLLKRYRGQR